MSRQIVKGSTDVILYVHIRDSVTGVVETGFDVTTLDFQYTRTGEAPVVKQDVTALAETDSDHADNKAIEVDGTNSPGLCRVDFPDAAFATGVDAVVLSVTGAGFDISPKEIELTEPLLTTASIATAVMASTIDGTLDMTEALTVLLALAVAKKIEVFGSTYTFQDQSGNTKVTITYDAATGTAVIT